MEAENNSTIKNNLPPSIPVFVDRVQELEQFERLVSDPGVNIVTVSGPAGIGKTAFAREAAGRQVENKRFPGGVVWLNCEVLNTLPNILARIAEVLGLDFASLSSGELRNTVLRHLSSASTLLVFDVYEAVAEDDSILSFIGHLPRPTKVLILTRKNVRVPGREISLRLAPFDEPVAMELWRQYLKSEGLAEENIETLREIYRQTGGLPLALRLVAGLIEQGQSPLEILEEFQDRTIPEKIVGGFVLDQVYATLSQQQTRFLEALSTFAHPADGTAIAFVAKMRNWRLPAETLVRKAVIDSIDGRYTLHPLTRAYIQNRVEREQLTTFQQRMVQHYLTYIEKHQYDFDQIEREWPNIQYAFETAYHNELWQQFMEFILQLGTFLIARGYRDEYQNWLNQGLEISEKVGDSSTKAFLLHNLAVQYQERGDLDSAVELYRQSLALKKATGDPAAESATLTNIGSVYRSRGDIRRAIDYYEQALAISREIGDRLGEANILGSLGVSYADLGDYLRSTAYYEQALAISRELGDRQGEANALSNLGAGYASIGDLDRAIGFYYRAVAISEEIGDWRAIASLYANLGSAYSELPTGDRTANLQQAIDFYYRAVAISEEIGDRRAIASLYGNLGSAYSDLPTGDRAANLQQAIDFYYRAVAISEEIGDRQAIASLYGNLGSAYSDLPTGDRAANLQQAIDFYYRASETFGAETHPLEYASVQNNLANVYANLTIGNKAENLEKAIACYQRVLQIVTRESQPLVWAATQSNLAVVLSQRERGDRTENLKRAIASYEQALSVYTKKSFPRDWLRVTVNLSTAYAEIGNWSDAKERAINILQSFQDVVADPESLEALIPWYQRLGEMAISNQDPEFAARIYAEAAYRLELQGRKASGPICDRLIELREQVGDDRFVVIWAEAQRVLTPALAQTLDEARELMSKERFSEAADKFSTAITLISETDEIKELKRQKATILFLRGFCLRKQELWEDALEDQEEAFRLFEELRDYIGEAHTFLEMGHLFEVMNNYEYARLHYMDAYRLYRRAEDEHGMAQASESLGRLEYRVRMFSQAVQNLEEARRLYVSVGDRIRARSIDSDLESAKASLKYQAAKNNRQGDNE